MDKEIIKHYDTGEITIKWEPSICIHSGICARTLPSVFKPKERPWVQYENGTSTEIKSAIDQCPSGALSYTENAQKPSENLNNNIDMTQVEIIPNGPLKITNGFEQKAEDGTFNEVTKPTFFCRCGTSKNEPYCDGSHAKSGFVG